MVRVKRIVLDVLKPHQPNALEFSQAIAEVGADYHVHLIVLEVDKSTETIQIELEGSAIDFEMIQNPLSSRRYLGKTRIVFHHAQNSYREVPYLCSPPTQYWP